MNYKDIRDDMTREQINTIKEDTSEAETLWRLQKELKNLHAEEQKKDDIADLLKVIADKLQIIADRM